MSPEQASGRGPRGRPARPTSTRSGAILYEMLAGRPAVPGRDPAGDARASSSTRTRSAPTRLRAEGPARPGDDLPEVPGEAPRAPLRRRPRSWPRTSTGSSTTSSIRARPVAAPERVWRWCRRKTLAGRRAGPGRGWRSPSTIGLSISLAVYQYQAAAADRRGARARSESRRRQVDQLAAHLAYDHGQALCEQGDVAQGLLWLVRGPEGGRARRRRRPGAGLPARPRRLAGPDPPAPGPLGAPRRRSRPSPSAPTAGPSPPPATTARSGSGTPPPASRSARPCTTREGHGRWPSAPTAGPSLTGCDDSVARLWDVATGAPVGPDLRPRRRRSSAWPSAPTAGPS